MKKLIFIILSLFISLSFAKEMPTPLQPSQAFQFKLFLAEKDKLILKWTIAPDYYLYKDRIQITTAPESSVKIGAIQLPEGSDHVSTTGTYQIYTGELMVPIQLLDHTRGLLDITIGYQGCSSKGFCYSPIKKHLQLDIGNQKTNEDLTSYIGQSIVKSAESTVTEQEFAQKIFDGSSLWFIILSFLGLGLLLSFTPCVLPMVPILSGIIMGHRHKLTTLKTFGLSFAYVAGMAVTYAIAGLVVALAGSRVQTVLQSSWVILIFSGLFVLLGLSLFGVYELQLPPRLQKWLTSLSNKQKGGTYVGVFFMGSISSLIVSPCVSAPLVGVLAYIAQTGDTLLGFVALLALGFGMGVPLLLLGASAGSLLPKAGNWMLIIERLMGVLMLAFAIWMAGRVLPPPLTLLLWGLLCAGLAVYLGVFTRGFGETKRLHRGLGLILLIYGFILGIGAGFGNSDPLNPWSNGLFSSKIEKAPLSYVELKDPTQLDQALLIAKQQKKYVMLDFYADWCESCVRMEHHVFTQNHIINALKPFVLLRVDVTQNNDFDQAILKRFNVIAPPTFIFFNQSGEELTRDRVVGELSSNEFLKVLTKIEER